MTDTVAAIYLFGGIFIFLSLMIGNYGGFVCTVVRYSKKPQKVKKKGKIVLAQPKLSFSEKLPAYIPGYQVSVALESLYGKGKAVGIASTVGVVFITLNCIVSWFFPFNQIILLVLHYLFYIGAVIVVLSYCIPTFIICGLYDGGRLLKLGCLLLPTVFCSFLKSNIIVVTADMRKSDRFGGDNGEVIKQEPLS